MAEGISFRFEFILHQCVTSNFIYSFAVTSSKNIISWRGDKKLPHLPLRCALLEWIFKNLLSSHAITIARKCDLRGFLKVNESDSFNCTEYYENYHEEKWYQNIYNKDEGRGIENVTFRNIKSEILCGYICHFLYR